MWRMSLIRCTCTLNQLQIIGIRIHEIGRQHFGYRLKIKSHFYTAGLRKIFDASAFNYRLQCYNDNPLRKPNLRN